MRLSELFAKTQRTPPKDEESKNAKLLEQAGFIQKLSAGVYTFLPLGLRVLNKIENIVREEMNGAGGVEILMPSLHPKENWEITGRWQAFDALFKTKSNFGGEYALGPTHEEILYALLKKHISSYRDLPVYIYQIQTKFRDEKRPKAGLLRAREFRMKDLYSFHANDKDRDKYYEVMKETYITVFKKLGLNVIPTIASGGTFSELSMEFQVVSDAGEDIIFLCEKCDLAVNKEVASKADAKSDKCSNCSGITKEIKAIEAGNIFPLKEKYANDFNLNFKDEAGKEKLVSAGCYGLGTSRVMGIIAEVMSDEKGLIWPKGVAPFTIHLIAVGESPKVKKAGEKLYVDLTARSREVLYDDRAEKMAGEKFADADLLGIPLRMVVSEKTLEKDSVELKERNSETIRLETIKTFLEKYDK
ncbi:MAG: Prolyl-tRNA synthetase [Candidatus Giovannonibacteria bacterium GW2011_GWC2_44_9]|uniref:Proline--tRNA ligase n=3 Tax=Candidatus Giovannoniibacteriota TaxID=1752738 RepID=A0A0G1IXV6_9BACT|nr:MAG: Prolyl-tRNA synthetase [Candidatus Giovannonibacteria bacterium GW2011_GWB1_44_23]KKT63920.1 MAG: Prolyl-tRNA synthetase [Candidatus Giovannonibacteria bacterium GW2011_GWA1_44_29]KKT83167.1 MAG: Prolyl-tRNA synthetase [Candidatus Giovannonibacteria bacterium GW2011_GWC2_44_9]KKT91633.1 MAG: Proline-tRNA ligase [Parcubacteria group bacterium GW2011_GWC1_45_13]